MDCVESRFEVKRIKVGETVKSFDCGDEDLNNFILKDAPLFYKVRLSTTYVLEDHDTGDVIGYFSLAHQQDNKAGCRFITVDAYANAIPFYLNLGFSPLSKEDEGAETRLLYFDLKQLEE